MPHLPAGVTLDDRDDLDTTECPAHGEVLIVDQSSATEGILIYLEADLSCGCTVDRVVNTLTLTREP